MVRGQLSILSTVGSFTVNALYHCFRVDPATFYEEKPPSGRPYIMSPFAGCMNIIAAWPVPERAKDAVCVCQ